MQPNCKLKREPDVIDVKIDGHVPIPSYRRQVKWPALYVMEVGESFLVLADEFNSLKQGSVHCRKLTDRKFIIRQVAYNAYRIWRVL